MTQLNTIQIEVYIAIQKKVEQVLHPNYMVDFPGP
jgi:hypothetical protein